MTPPVGGRLKPLRVQSLQPPMPDDAMPTLASIPHRTARLAALLLLVVGGAVWPPSAAADAAAPEAVVVAARVDGAGRAILPEAARRLAAGEAGVYVPALEQAPTEAGGAAGAAAGRDARVPHRPADGTGRSVRRSVCRYLLGCVYRL